MPGMNQRGPMNEGPMTGGRRGVCTNPDAADQWYPGQAAGQGLGRGRGRGRGMCLRPLRQAAPARKDEPETSALQDRVNMLEAELAAVKRQMTHQPE